MLRLSMAARNWALPLKLDEELISPANNQSHFLCRSTHFEQANCCVLFLQLQQRELEAGP
jgi:hypothetical protein